MNNEFYGLNNKYNYLKSDFIKLIILQYTC